MYKALKVQSILMAATLAILLVCQTGFTADNQVDINHASLEELMSLKYVGEIIAKRIIEHREMIGGFKTIESIMDIKGFGPKAWEANKDRLIITPYKKKEG